ncbi:MAG TPA: PAS domain-containing sensor histidine kinase, partial [Acidimicrobiales bacterium]|nr:PAS domain-containing sensor histidine kinase [Acidimicrobiales bacterium]
MDPDQLPDALLVLDPDRSIAAANAAAATLTGYPAEDLVGRRVADVLRSSGQDGDAVWATSWPASTRLRSVRGVPEQEVVVRRADGSELAARATASYQRDGQGHLTGAVLSLRDARRRAGDLASGIEIVSTVSHELRSPLSSVKGFVSLLLNRGDRLSAEDKRMMLEQVNLDADRITRLVTELLDISRLATGRLVLRREPVDLAGLAARVVATVGLTYPALDASLRFPDAFPRAWADPDKVTQVLTNLVENACKYASPEGLEVAGEVGGGEVTVTVRDQGPGMAPEELSRLFTKFQGTRVGRPSGSGLGLWISQGLVEAHGGRLSADSRPGEGAEFRFTLPIAEVDIPGQGGPGTGGGAGSAPDPGDALA